MRIPLAVLMGLFVVSAGQAQILRTEKFHGGDLIVQVVKYPAPVVENLGDSSEVLDEYRLKFSVTEGKCFRTYFLSGDLIKSVAVSAPITDGEEGGKLETPFLPQPGEDLVILAQNCDGKWQMKVVPSEIFTVEEKEETEASLVDTMYPEAILNLLRDGE